MPCQPPPCQPLPLRPRSPRRPRQPPASPHQNAACAPRAPGGRSRAPAGGWAGRANGSCRREPEGPARRLRLHAPTPAHRPGSRPHEGPQMTRPAAFAIPGDIATVTGGFLYERQLLEGLRAAGRPVEHIRLGAGFPDPTAAETAHAVARIAALPPEIPLLLDGLVFGAIDTDGLARARAPI